jgi:hypothetical protein
LLAWRYLFLLSSGLGFLEGGKKENDAIPTSGRYFVLSPLVGSSLYNNTFHACGLRSVQSKVLYCSVGRNWMDGWIDIYIKGAGRLL